jgi:hypothetical protein
MTRDPLAIPRLPTQRQRRKGEWTEQKAVTFIVALATRGNVTLAARLAGMSRKAAYALRRRDNGFAKAWDAALVIAAARVAAKGDSKVHNPPFAPPKGNNRPAVVRKVRAEDERRRDAFFANLASRPQTHRAAPSQ